MNWKGSLSSMYISSIVQRHVHYLPCCVQVQVVALECLPRIPAHKLRKALAGEDLGKRILLCLTNSSKEVSPSDMLRHFANSDKV